MEEREARLRIKRRMLLERLAELGEFVRGSVVLMKRPCTYATCRKCASGERHPTWGLTVSEKGKTRTMYLGVGRLAAARQMTRNYRRLQAIIEQVSQINRALLQGRVSRKGKGSGDGQSGKGP